MTALRPDIIKQSIANLLIAYPELAEDELLRADMIEGETQAHEFLSMIVKQIGETNALSAGIDGYLKELCDRQSRYGRRVEALRLLAFKIMSAADLRKVELPIATLSIAQGRPKVIITNEEDLPDIACKFERKPDKAKIKELLETEPYVVAGATLSNAEPVLTIRTK